jgi:hypothetical protein
MWWESREGSCRSESESVWNPHKSRDTPHRARFQIHHLILVSWNRIQIRIKVHSWIGIRIQSQDVEAQSRAMEGRGRSQRIHNRIEAKRHIRIRMKVKKKDPE